jgi:tellurite resistance protein
VREIAGTHGTGFGLTASAQEVESETLAALASGIAALEAKAPDELDGYRELVLAVADAVAQAKGGGVSAEEVAALEKVNRALGT